MKITAVAGSGDAVGHTWGLSGDLRGEPSGTRRVSGAALLVALALFVAVVLVVVSLPLAQGPSASRGQVRHGQARQSLHGLAALPLAARGVVGRALAAGDRRWFAHPSAGGFVLGNRGAGVQASFSRREVIVRSGARRS
jgi:hypothetical protein